MASKEVKKILIDPDFDNLLKETPDPLKEKGLVYEWYTNADPDFVKQAGDDVIHRFRYTNEEKRIENARIGKPSAAYPSGCGIYVLKPDSP